MAWIYLAESEDSVWPCHHGCGQSPIVKTTDTLKLFYCLGCTTVSFLPPQYGTTLPRSYLSCCPDRKLTSSTAGSRARTSALRATEKAWKEADRSYFSKSFAWLASFDRGSFSWKTSQLSLSGGLTEFSWSSLRSGSIVDGRLYQPERWVPRTCENAGSSLPTPTARDFKSPGLSRTRKASIQRRQGLPLSVWFKEEFGKNLHPSFLEWMMGYPQKHTALGHWVIQWYRPKRVKRSGDCVDCEKSLSQTVSKE